MRALRLMLVSSMVLTSSLVNAKMLKTDLEIRSALVGTSEMSIAATRLAGCGTLSEVACLMRAPRS